MAKKISFSLKLRKSFFSMLFIVIGVVLVWRGLWDLMEMYILPDHPFWSNVVGIIVGILILYLPDNDIKELV